MPAMNEITLDPQGVDDPALLAEIEAEFAELTREIERISAMPRSMAPEKGKLIEALRSSWRSRLDVAGVKDRPEWRQRLDTTIGHAVDRLLETGIQENSDGSLGFALRGDVLQAEGGPVIRGLLEGFANMLEERFPAPDKAPPPAPDAPPPNPLQALFGNLGQAFAGVLKTAIQNAGTAAAGAVVKVDQDGQVTSAPPAQANPDATKIDLGLSGEHKLSTSFAFDSRGAPEPATDAAATPTQATPPSPAAVATNAFFQQLMQGFGQAIKTAVQPNPQPPAAATPAPASAPPHATGATGATPPPQASPLAGLGQLLSQALQRAVGPGGAPIVMHAVQPTTPAPDGSAETTATPAGPSTSETTATASTEPPANSPEVPKAPTLQIDFAGLLSQLLSGGKKPPGT